MMRELEEMSELCKTPVESSGEREIEDLESLRDMYVLSNISPTAESYAQSLYTPAKDTVGRRQCWTFRYG
jgi:hypothetical protein